MTTLDWILLALYALALIHGFWRGLVLELMALVGWIVGFVLAPRYAQLLSSYLPMQGAGPALKYVVGFVLVLLLTLVAVGLIARLIHRLIDWAGLGVVDRLLGGLFSIVKTTIVCLCLTIVVNLTPLKQIDLWRESIGANVLVELMTQLKPLLPLEYGKYVN
jgi:membrane protein required for colicin V production